jgi:hypothetical protein
MSYGQLRALAGLLMIERIERIERDSLSSHVRRLQKCRPQAIARKNLIKPGDTPACLFRGNGEFPGSWLPLLQLHQPHQLQRIVPLPPRIEPAFQRPNPRDPILL